MYIRLCRPCSPAESSEFLEVTQVLNKNELYAIAEVSCTPGLHLAEYFFLPISRGMYLYLIICLICLLMVNAKRATKYIKRIGQNTGISKIEKKVKKKHKKVTLIELCQNLNSGNLLMKGRNSSVNSPASNSSFCSFCCKDTSNFGVKKPRN